MSEGLDGTHLKMRSLSLCLFRSSLCLFHPVVYAIYSVSLLFVVLLLLSLPSFFLQSHSFNRSGSGMALSIGGTTFPGLTAKRMTLEQITLLEQAYSTACSHINGFDYQFGQDETNSKGENLYVCGSRCGLLPIDGPFTQHLLDWDRRRYASALLVNEWDHKKDMQGLRPRVLYLPEVNRTWTRIVANQTDSRWIFSWRTEPFPVGPLAWTNHSQTPFQWSNNAADEVSLEYYRAHRAATEAYARVQPNVYSPYSNLNCRLELRSAPGTRISLFIVMNLLYETHAEITVNDWPKVVFEVWSPVQDVNETQTAPSWVEQWMEPNAAGTPRNKDARRIFSSYHHALALCSKQTALFKCEKYRTNSLQTISYNSEVMSDSNSLLIKLMTHPTHAEHLEFESRENPLDYATDFRRHIALTYSIHGQTTPCSDDAAMKYRQEQGTSSADNIQWPEGMRVGCNAGTATLRPLDD